MSVPSHVHNKQHACPTDLFEDVSDVEGPAASWASYWTAPDILRLRGGFIDVWKDCPTQDPLYLLMYPMSQVADHFAAYYRDGNDNYIPVGELDRIYGVYNLGFPTSGDSYADDNYNDYGIFQSCGVAASCPCPYYFNNGNVANIRDYSYTYAVRAVSGLLFWFAKECGLLSTCSQPVVYLENAILRNNVLLEGQSVDVGSSVTSAQVDGAVEVIAKGGSLVDFKAADEIILRHGFSVARNSPLDFSYSPPIPGDDFRAHIAPCASSSCNE